MYTRLEVLKYRRVEVFQKLSGTNKSACFMVHITFADCVQGLKMVAGTIYRKYTVIERHVKICLPAFTRGFFSVALRQTRG